jgi:hypothetical protein
MSVVIYNISFLSKIMMSISEPLTQEKARKEPTVTNLEDEGAKVEGIMKTCATAGNPQRNSLACDVATLRRWE